MPKRFSRGWLVASMLAACINAYPARQGKQSQSYLSDSKFADFVRNDYDFEDFSPEKYIGDRDKGSLESFENDGISSTAVKYVRLSQAVEPDAEMLPAHYTGVLPPGVDHMELKASDSASMGSNLESNIAEGRMMPTGIAAVSLARSSPGTKGGTGLQKNEDFKKHLTAGSGKEERKGEYTEATGTKKARAEDDEYSGKRRDESSAGRSADFKAENQRQKGRNAAGYHNIYHKDEFKKDADFYDNDHKGEHYRKHGHYDEKHSSTETDFRNGDNRASEFLNADAAKTGKLEKLRVKENSKDHKSSSGHGSSYDKFDEFAKQTGTGQLFGKSQGAQPNDITNIKLRIALPADYDDVIEFMCKFYFKSEPSLINIGLAAEEDPPAPLIHLMQQQIKEGMTIIAEDGKNCMIGAVVNAGSCPWYPDRMIEYAECCCERGPIRDIIKFNAYIMKEPNLWDKYCVSKVFECSFVSVDSQYRGMGIGSRLIKESWYLARDCGYPAFRIDCTSIYTAAIAEKFGWESVFSVPYRRYIDSGGLVFKCIQEPHTEVRVYADRPLTCKDYCYSNPDNCKIGTAPGGK